MALVFDFENLVTVEFGVGRDTCVARVFNCIPADTDVQDALQEMAETTWQLLSAMEQDIAPYNPAEKHASQEYLILPLMDELSFSMRELHEAINLPVDINALNEPSRVFSYFARFTDAQGRHLTALRRATQFKGVLKNRLIRLITDDLRIIEDKVFKLDVDFDLLIDNENIHILRPAGFEFAGQLQNAVMNAVPNNIVALQNDLEFVNFESISTYASIHPRAARYIASIRSAAETQNISRQKLEELCRSTGVEYTEQDGRLYVNSGHVMGFLEVLDRRRYELELVDGLPEQFRAQSRQRL